MSDTKYYLKRKGSSKSKGPYALSMIKLNVKEGKIKKDDLLSEDGELWVEVASVPEVSAKSKPKLGKSTSGRIKKPKGGKSSPRPKRPREDDEFEPHIEKKSNAAYAYWEERPKEEKKSPFAGIKISVMDAVKIVVMITVGYICYHYVYVKKVFDEETPRQKELRLKAEKQAKKEARREAWNKQNKDKKAVVAEKTEGKKQRGTGLSPLSEAVHKGDFAKVKELLDAGADASGTQVDRSPPLSWAIYNDYPTILNLLIKHKADVNGTNATGDPHLFLAVKKERVEMIRSLVQAGAKVNFMSKKGQTALDLAIEKSNEKMIGILKVNGAVSFNELVKYVTHGLVEKVEHVLEIAPGYAKLKVGEFETLLHQSILCIDKKKRKAIMKILLKAGTPIDGRNEDGMTALLLAVELLDLKLVEFLLDQGASVKITNRRRQSPLILLVYQEGENIAEIATLLKKAGNDFTYKNRLQKNIAHYAAEQGNLDLLRWLVKDGFDMSKVCLLKTTPLDVAIENKHGKCIDYLESL